MPLWVQRPSLEISNIKETAHHGNALSLLALGDSEDEARESFAHRLCENFGGGDAKTAALLTPEPDVWHTESEPVFEI